jgi:16S rRNA (guanine527-N7)-methyltransferase
MGLRDKWIEYAGLTVEWAKRTDLTAAVTPAGLLDVLFLDAVELLAAGLLGAGMTVVDIGSGVGAPALPLALALPGTRWTLIEPRRRRVVFLRMAIGTLGLAPRVEVIEAKVDPEDPQLGPYDCAMSRATFSSAEWLRLGQRIARDVIVFAGPSGLPDEAHGEPRAVRQYRTLERATPRSIALY